MGTAKGSHFGGAGAGAPERASPLLLYIFSLPAAHGILDDAQECIAVAGGFLLAHTADIQQFVGAQRLFLHHLPQGGVTEHHKGRDILFSTSSDSSVEKQGALILCFIPGCQPRG